MMNSIALYRLAAMRFLYFCCVYSLPFSSSQAIDFSPAPHVIDPHVYVYTREFAKRFGMPEAWVSDELEGVDAVAYRVMPTYMSCGWAGRIDTCFRHKTRCELDLYFDQRRNPLHWDERHPLYETSPEGYSSNFISSTFHDRSPVRPGEHLIVRRSPLLDSLNGKGATWRYRFNTEGSRGSGFALNSGYERNAFDHVDRVTLNLGCFDGLNHLDLVSEEFMKSRGKVILGILKTVTFPDTWSVRKKIEDEKKDWRINFFLREEGEKALRAIREKSLRNIPIFLVP